MTEPSEKSERELRLEAEAKLALAEVELRISKAEAEQRITILEVQLASEREAHAYALHGLEASEASRVEQIDQLQAELALWRRDEDRDALLRALAARVRVIERSADQIGAGPHSDAMQAILAKQRAERADLLAAIERLKPG
jgi:hypothetical protein